MTVGFLLGQRQDGRPTPVRVDDFGRVRLAPIAFDWRAVTPSDGDVGAVLARLCDVFGVATTGQVEKLRALPWACTKKILVQVGEQSREVIVLHRRSLAGWLFTLNAGKVRPELREKLATYQREAADAEGQPGVFAPSWAILQTVLQERRLQRRWFFGLNRDAALEEARARELEAWRAYVPAYLAEMRASYRRHRDAWKRLLARERVVLACHCQAPERCHRTVLATMILPRLGAEYRGELASRRDGVHVEIVEVAA